MPTRSVNNFRICLLRWYDAHARDLPWRADPAKRADPYRVWLSEIMLQQTTTVSAAPYYKKFIARWPTLAALAAAPLDDVLQSWAGLGYYNRARNLHRCAQLLIADHGGAIPADLKTLLTLPGIGDYTANAIRAIAFDQPATVIDGNVERVVSRLFAITRPLPAAKKTIRACALALSDNRTDRPGAFAQAMMDLGSTVCTPRTPSCNLCPVQLFCAAHKQGIANTLPQKIKTARRLQRAGIVYWVTDKMGHVLIGKGPPTGLLAGMDALPVTEWIDAQKSAPLCVPDLLTKQTAIETGIQIRQVFSHFDLVLSIWRVRWHGRKTVPAPYRWISADALQDLAWPALYRKVILRMINS